MPLSAVVSSSEQAEISKFADGEIQVKALTAQLADINQRLRSLQQDAPDLLEVEAGLNAQVDLARRKIAKLKTENNQRRVALYALKFERVQQTDGTYQYRLDSQTGEASWRVGKISREQITFVGGGRVVGTIPVGLPSFSIPHVHWDMLIVLLPGAMVMALIGFLEATSISRAISAMTRERINPSRELIGQGLANIVGSFFQSFVVSGSFSRTAVAARMGARTGIFALVSALAVALVLLFFTSYLYHLPLAVLAVIVMLAVFDLIKIRPLLMAWRVDRPSAVIGVITFVATLAMAPSIANGVLLGVALTVLQLLVRQMKPRAALLGLLPDGSMSDITTRAPAPISKHFVTVRYDGSLDFLNAAHFEEVILQALVAYPESRTILVIGSGINSLDASGEEKIREIAQSMKEANVTLAFSSLKQQVREKFDRAGLKDLLGEENLFMTRESAIKILQERFTVAVPVAQS